MRTERQIEASRANGARSRGPVTPEGKRNSSRNSTRHGMLAESVVLEGESQERFVELLAEIDGELQPETPVEHALVQKMAVAQWRQFRLWTLEKTAIDHQIRKQAETVGCNEHKATCASLAFRALADESRSLDLFHRYDSLCDRQYLRAHKRFLELRRGRGDSPAPAPSNPRPEVPPAPEAFAPEPQRLGGSRYATRMGTVRSGAVGTRRGTRQTKNNQTNPTTRWKHSNPPQRTRRLNLPRQINLRLTLPHPNRKPARILPQN